MASHHHFDHTGGLRTYVAEGRQVVTHHSNVSTRSRRWRVRATLVKDRLSLNPRDAAIVGVSDKYEIHRWQADAGVRASGDDPHHYYALAYLPGPKVLVQNDS